jgi:tetratricopeptide (TPR) repeat protein
MANTGAASGGPSLLDDLTLGQYAEILGGSAGEALIRDFARDLRPKEGFKGDAAEQGEETAGVDEVSVENKAAIGLAALNAFLQANVTGPVFDGAGRVERIFAQAFDRKTEDSLSSLRKACFKNLDVDGVSPYPYIPHIELFSLARYIFTEAISSSERGIVALTGEDEASNKISLVWTRLRIHVWHYKLLTQPSLGPGSIFTRSSQWSDVPSLAGLILEGIIQLKKETLGENVWSTVEACRQEEKLQCLVEIANYNIMLGRDDEARKDLRQAAEMSGFLYALSGALGKRTRFQEKTTSQLVVLAKSAAVPAKIHVEDGAKPDVLALNDDTLLENIDFTKPQNGATNDAAKLSILPEALAGLEPDHQPQLSALDQIILLTEATLKDSFSPVDTLTSEEILPYAVRVISDTSTNWQIYSQALLIRSRIEVHRSRTVERGVLQMQAVVDQVIVDTSADTEAEKSDDKISNIPAIEVSGPDSTLNESSAGSNGNDQKPTSFFRAAKPAESAPAHVRLKYIHTLSSPPRWHLEPELAYSWAGVGSLVSALEIFKRLRLWAEVALCLASSANADDEDGRGSGGEEKAKGIIRWQLFHRTGEQSNLLDPDEDLGDQDVTTLKSQDFTGPERIPPPPNAPRLFCILGDMENEPAHYLRAWELSKHRFSRAQKSLGEHYLKNRDWENALQAYKLATSVNRLNPDMWSRLGDINLRLGKFEDAAEAYGRGIGAAADGVLGGEDARTWSNLGSSLWSLYLEAVDELKKEEKKALDDDEHNSDSDQQTDGSGTKGTAQEAAAKRRRDPGTLLARSLVAYKRGAAIAQDNWRIWDNVLTLAGRIRPPSILDMVLAIRNIIRIRGTEDALDEGVLRLMLQEGVLAKEKEATVTEGVYELPRGSVERMVNELFEKDMQGVITAKSSLWELLSRLRVWKRDFAGALEAAEKAWRAAMAISAVSSTSSGGSSLQPPSRTGAADSPSSMARNWLEDKQAWDEVVRRTDELVSALENFGPGVDGVGDKWRGKARSAVRSVMGKGKEAWEGSEGWRTLEGLLEGLKR